MPTASNDVITTNEDVAVNGNVSTNDTPSGDGGNTWTLVGANGGAANGTVTMNSDGTYTYTPELNFNGTDVFTYQLCDANGDCSTATVTVTVNPVNDLPTAANDIITTNEDEAISGNVSTNDTPSGDGGNVWTLVGVNGGATNGTVTMNADGTYTYTPNANFNGTDEFTYQLCDANNDCSTATVTVTVNPVNDLPTVSNDVITTNEDEAISGNVSTNDTPSGDGGNNWTLVGANGGAANGTVSMNSDGTYTYTPAQNFNGTDVFTYQLCDINSDCSTATVKVTVNPVNDLPTVSNDVITTKEDVAASGNVSTNDTPSGDGGNIWTLVGANGGATNGTVSMNADGTFTYTPNANFNGTDVFTYQLCDINGDCSTATVKVTVNSVTLPRANLSIRKTVSNQTPKVGESVTFTITASNQGPDAASNVSVTDILPSGYTFIKATPSKGNWTSPTWNIGSLSNGGSATLTMEALVNATGNYINTASISGSENDPEPGNNTSSSTPVPVPQTDLSIVKTVDETNPFVGSEITFTITVTNVGPSAATGVNVNEVLPSGFTFVNATPSSGTWTAPNWNIGSLPIGGSETLILVASVNAEGSYTNTAVISGSENDPNTENNTSSVTITKNNILKIPNGFSPNGDNINDLYVIPGIENFPDCELSVYNRWGNVVYKTKGYQNDWDGTPNVRTAGNGKVQQGTYFYVLDFHKDNLPAAHGFIVIQY